MSRKEANAGIAEPFAPITSGDNRNLFPDDIEYGQVVAYTAAEHKEVPDRVMVSVPLPDIEQHAERIKGSAHRETQQGEGR